MLEVKRLAFGDLQLTTLHDGPFRLDGGAMFGVVPRPLWEKLAPPDDRHRIQLAMRPLLVEADWGRMLVDCGAGDKMAPKQRDIYALDRARHLDHALAEAGLTAASIDVALATHLHFDHFGGATVRDGGALMPRFPKAHYSIRAAEWEDATHPHERNRASYLQDDFVPLEDAGVVRFFEGDMTIRPGVRVVRTGGHTGQHQIVFIESGGQDRRVRGRPDSDDRAPPGSLGDGLRPVSDGDAGVQAAVHPRGHRPRVPDLLRARSASWPPATSGRTRRASATSSRCCKISASKARRYDA